MRKSRPTIRRSRLRWAWLATGALLLFALALAACGDATAAPLEVTYYYLPG